MGYDGLRKAAATKGWTIEGDSALREALVSMPITITGREDGVRVQLVRVSALHTLSTNAFFEPIIRSPFEISTEGVTGAIASALGIEDVQIGDEAFDREFRLVSKEPDALKKLLTPHVRAVVEELAVEAKPFGSHFRITESVVWLQRPNWGTITEEEVLHDIPLCVRAVQTIQAAAKAASLA
jgi:hypothetical protein